MCNDANETLSAASLLQRRKGCWLVLAVALLSAAEATVAKKHCYLENCLVDKQIMSVYLLSASRQRKRRGRTGGSGGGSGAKVTRQGGGQGHGKAGACVQVYLHAVTDTEAVVLTGTGSKRPLQDVKRKSGADVQFHPNPSPVQGMKIVVIRGDSSQIDAAVRLISQETGAQGTILAQAQTFWLRWVQDSFPDLDSRPYFLPPVYVNRVPMTRESAAGQDVLVFQSAPGQAGGQTSKQTPRGRTGQCNQAARISCSSANPSIPQPPQFQESEFRDDRAMQRVLFCLQNMSERRREILVGLSQLQFGEYLGKPCYAAAAAYLPLSTNLPPVYSQNWRRGDFDVVLIHRHYGFVVCEIKSVGDNFKQLNMSQQDIDTNIRKKLKEAVSQLDKAAAMLSHLVSDVTPGIHITKTIAVPNLTAQQVQQAVSSDPDLIKVLCQCLGTTAPADISGLCLCSDQLSDPKTPWDVDCKVLRALRYWWKHRVTANGPDKHMTCDLYKILVARFCGPATTVTLPCISPPRLCVKTLGQAVSLTGDLYTAHITLFPEQVQLLTMAPPRLLVVGPPGTGKTVVLLLMAKEWLRRGNEVYVVSTYGIRSSTACIMLYHLLQQAVSVSPGQLHLLQCDIFYEQEMEKMVNDLSRAAKGGSLYVVADEAGLLYPLMSDMFHGFCNKLLAQVPDLHLWGASCYHKKLPSSWQVEFLTRPLRSPPAVIREVQKAGEITDNREVQTYSDRGVPDHTDGPPVKRLYHRGQGHSEEDVRNCVTCGQELGHFLTSLCIGLAANVPAAAVTVPTNSTPTITIATGSDTTPPCLQWRDVLVLCFSEVTDDSGAVRGLKAAGVPLRVMKEDDAQDAEDVAMARSDVVWVADGNCTRGLERKVVVSFGNIDEDHVRLHFMSRCTSQLVIVSEYEDSDSNSDDESAEDESHS